MLLRQRPLSPVDFGSNMSDAGDLLEGQFVAIAGENHMGDVVVWYASVKGGEGLWVVLVRQILVEYDEYCGLCKCLYLQTCKKDVHS